MPVRISVSLPTMDSRISSAARSSPSRTHLLPQVAETGDHARELTAQRHRLARFQHQPRCRPGPRYGGELDSSRANRIDSERVAWYLKDPHVGLQPHQKSHARGEDQSARLRVVFKTYGTLIRRPTAQGSERPRGVGLRRLLLCLRLGWEAGREECVPLRWRLWRDRGARWPRARTRRLVPRPSEAGPPGWR